LKTAIVILNYNGKDLIAKYLPSIIQFGSGADIWVVDNASTDLSLEFIHKNHPTVKTLKLKKNLGYSGGYNACVQKIDADLLCFINNDVGVDSAWIPQIEDHFKKHHGVAIIQPKILSDVHDGFFDYAGAAGGRIDFMGLPYCRGRALQYCAKDRGQYNDVASIQWASGAAFCIRRDVFLELDGFDEDFFMHFEEIDLSIRALANGWQIHYIGISQVKHLGGASLQTNNPTKLFYNIRNSMLTYTKSLPLHVFVYWLFLRLVFDFFLGLYFVLTGRFKHMFAIVKGHHSFFYNFPLFWRKRSILFNPFQNKSVFIENFKVKLNTQYDIR
jgi:GT2 family glycosyltransferase